MENTTLEEKLLKIRERKELAIKSIWERAEVARLKSQATSARHRAIFERYDRALEEVDQEFVKVGRTIAIKKDLVDIRKKFMSNAIRGVLGIHPAGLNVLLTVQLAMSRQKMVANKPSHPAFQNAY